ncbi:MAG: hypothetical protein U5J83_15955 [Bryobacterales bacterium]|nr:hypothetical protein [Bryobacterales bacterium]
MTLVAAAMLLLLWGGYLASFLLMGARPGPTLAASLRSPSSTPWPLLVVGLFLRAPEDLAVAARTKPSRSERKQAKPMARKNRERKGDS